MKNIIIIILALTLLKVTNPSVESFNTYYGRKIERLQIDKNILESVVLEGKKLNAKFLVSRKDMFFYSTYEIETLGNKEEYIGIGGRFFESEKLEKGKEVLLDKLEGVHEKLSNKVNEVL